MRQNGEWGKALLGEEISEGSREANARLMALTERIANDEVRTAVKNLQAILTNYLTAKTEKQAKAAFNNAMDAYLPLMEQLGESLRNFY